MDPFVVCVYGAERPCPLQEEEKEEGAGIQRAFVHDID